MARIDILSATVLLTVISTLEAAWGETRLKPSNNLYKVALTQRGYIQFLRYQVEMPELYDFTLCIWMKTNNFSNPHPLFSYSKDEKDRLIRSWLAPPTHSRKTRVNLEVMEREVMSVAIDIEQGQWYHFCQSWSNTAGQWVLHVNGKLTAAGDDWQLKGLVIPGGGDVVVGQEYTDFDKGLDDGIEGEVFGFNLLTSHQRNRLSQHLRDGDGRNPQLPSSNRTPGIIFGSPSLATFKSQENTLNAPQQHAVNSAKGSNWLSLHPFRSFRETLRALTSDESSLKKVVRWPEESRDVRSSDKMVLSRKTLKGDLGRRLDASNVRWPDDHASNRKRWSRSLTRKNRQAFHALEVDTSVKAKQKRDTSTEANQHIRGERSYLQSWGFGEGTHTTLNPGLELVQKSYNQCTVGRGSPIEKSRLIIAWARTPVRVFGGAVIKSAKPVCGDF